MLINTLNIYFTNYILRQINWTMNNFQNNVLDNM